MKEGNSERIFLLMHVDDISLVGLDRQELDSIVKELGRHCDAENLGEAEHFLGIKIERGRDSKCIKLSQPQHAQNLLETFRMTDSRPNKLCMQPNLNLSKNMKATTEEKIEEMRQMPYQSLVGGIMHLANSPRADISYTVGVLPRFVSYPGKKH